MTKNEVEASGESPAPVARVLGNRSRTLPLTYPVEFAGKVYTEVTVTRLSVAQVAAYIDAVTGDGVDQRMPMFDVPSEVLEAMDDDDGMALDAVLKDFLPLRLQQAAERALKNGAATSPSAERS